MEIIKKDIQMTKTKVKITTQMTLDDDFNVPDIKPDIDKIVQERGEVKIIGVEAANDKARIKGDLVFTLLYVSDGDIKPIHSMSGTIPFEEAINVDGVKSNDIVKITYEIEDLSTSLINSRKVSVRSIITMNIIVEEEQVTKAAIGIEGIRDVQAIYQNIDISQLEINKKDVYRIRDELAISNNKPNIMEILWSTVDIKNAETKLYDDKINVKGDVSLFVLYMGEADDKPVEFVEFDIPFNGVVDCFGCREEMIASVNITTADKNIEIKPDLDGEERVFDIEIVLDLDVKIYNQEKVQVLKDVYSPTRELITSTKPTIYENLLLRNHTQCKVSDKVHIKSGESKILQVCHTDGTVKIDDLSVVDNGINVEGVILMQIMYVAADDKRPLNVVKEAIPFKHTIEAKGINNDSIYNVKPSIEFISCSMLDSEEIDVKAVVNMNALIFNQVNQHIITDIEEKPLDVKKIQELPSMVGYVVKSGDTLWNIAKKFFTTVDSIQKANNLSDSDSLRAGDKLVVIKNIEGILD